MRVLPIYVFAGKYAPLDANFKRSRFINVRNVQDETLATMQILIGEEYETALKVKKKLEKQPNDLVDYLVPIHDNGQVDFMKNFIIIPQYKETLAEYLQKNPNRNIEENLKVCCQITESLSQLHSLDIVHCNLRPENIYYFEEESCFKIGNYSRAKILPIKKIDYNQKMDFLYQAPEVANNLNFSQSADVFSLGLVIFQILVGDVKINGRSFQMLVSNGTSEEKDEIKRRIAQINNAEIEELLKKIILCEKRPTTLEIQSVFPKLDIIRKPNNHQESVKTTKHETETELQLFQKILAQHQALIKNLEKNNYELQARLEEKTQKREEITKPVMSQTRFMDLLNSSRIHKSCLNLSGFNLRQCVIERTNLEKSEIIKSDFIGMNLKLANFKGSTLGGCNFSNCDLSGVNFQDCDLEECDFTNAILYQTDFSNSKLGNAKLTHAKYFETKFIGSEFANTIGLDYSTLSKIEFCASTFSDCDFNQSNLTSSNFQKCHFTNCNFKCTVLTDTNLENSEFKNCKFNSQCKFEDTNLKNSTMNNVGGLVGVELVRVDLSGCKLTQTNISLYNIEGSNLSDCNVHIEASRFREKSISNCNLSGLNLSNIDFTGFKFEKVIFSNNNIEKSKFENVVFKHCKIQLHLHNGNLVNCKFEGCDFIGSIFEEIDGEIIIENLQTNQFTNCIFKKLDLKDLKDLSKLHECKYESCNFDGISSLITNFDISLELFNYTKSTALPQLLYRGSRDGFKATNFHSKCDNQGPTLTIIKSEYNQIFGGFTLQSWNSSNGEYVSDSSAFTFKVCQDATNQNYRLAKFNIEQDKNQCAIWLNRDYLPVFGGIDICVSSDCDLYANSFAQFSTFELPNGYQQGSEEAKRYLAGNYQFRVSEIEVFKTYQ